jgi:hypothetical protein
MRTVRLIVKRSLLGLFGLMVYAALGFSSNVPSSLRMARDEEWPASGRTAAPVVQKVLAPHGPQHRAGGELKPKSSSPKATKSMSRKGVSATHPSTDHKH